MVTTWRIKLEAAKKIDTGLKNGGNIIIQRPLELIPVDRCPKAIAHRRILGGHGRIRMQRCVRQIAGARRPGGPLAGTNLSQAAAFPLANVLDPGVGVKCKSWGSAKIFGGSDVRPEEKKMGLTKKNILGLVQSKIEKNLSSPHSKSGFCYLQH